MAYTYGKMSLNYASLLHVLSQPTSLFNSPRLDRRLDGDLLHQPAALTSACWRGPRTHARATTNFLEIKAADNLSGAGPPRHHVKRGSAGVVQLNRGFEPSLYILDAGWSDLIEISDVTRTVYISFVATRKGGCQ